MSRIRNRIAFLSTVCVLCAGAKHGWLDASVYAPVARKAFLALQDYIESNGDVRDVCCGTNIGNSREYYDKRRRITGDLHGQAPLIWCCAALAEYVKPAK